MIISIIHLSDIHLRDDVRIDWELVQKIAEAASSHKNSNNQCFILAITGDLTYSGSLEEALLFDSFLHELSKNLKEHDVVPEVLFVPGNHDIDHSNTPMSPDHRDGIDTSDDTASSIANELKKMEAFFLLANEDNVQSLAHFHSSIA